MSSAYSVKSMMPPLSAKPATCVLPKSMTSGGVSVDNAVVTFVLISVHCCVWIFTLAPVSLVNLSLIAFSVPAL